MTLSGCQVVPHLSPRWDTRGLCSPSPIKPTLIKAFCLMKWAAWESLWKGSYHLEAATGKEGGGSHTLNSSESQRAVLEPFRKRRIPSKDRSSGIWFNRHKAFLWQDAAGKAQTGIGAHRSRGNHPGWPLGICLSPLLTFLPDFYSTWLHRARVTLQGLGQPHKQKASSSRGNDQLKLPQKQGWPRQERNGSSSFVHFVALLPLCTIFLLVEIEILQFQPQMLF